jgi:hypothetical protein
VEVGLWSIGLPRRSSQWGIEGAAVVTATEQAALRLNRLVSVAEAATPAAINLPVSEGRDWYVPWAARMSVMSQHARIATESRPNGTALSQVTSTSEEQLARASEQLDLWIEQCDEIFAVSDLESLWKSSVSQAAGALWGTERRPASEWLYCVADGDSAQVVVNLCEKAATSSESRTVDLVLVFAAAVAALALMRSRAACDLLWRWPHAAAFLLGIVYWAWLRPSWVGLVIAAAGVLLALRPGWPGHLARTEGSTVMRAEHAR